MDVIGIPVALAALGLVPLVCLLKGKAASACAWLGGAAVAVGSAVWAVTQPGADPDVGPQVLLAAIGLDLMLVAGVASLRLARPRSVWAVRLYPAPKLRRAEERFAAAHPRSLIAFGAAGLGAILIVFFFLEFLE